MKEAYFDEMRRLLSLQTARYPLMNEEDAVKFAFQALLGPGHLVASKERALLRLRAETKELTATLNEPLAEALSPDWVRLNLRPALAIGLSEERIADWLFLSAAKPLSFTRKDVYDFCLLLDASVRMQAAAARVLDEGFLPSHSKAYKDAYSPAYRVLNAQVLPEEIFNTPR